MKDDTVVALHQPGSFSDDPLTDILRAGAHRLLAQAVEAVLASMPTSRAVSEETGA